MEKENDCDPIKALPQKVEVVESELRELAKIVATLTVNVNSIVENQKQINEMVNKQTAHAVEMEHFRETLSRVFKWLEKLDEKLTNMEKAIAISGAVKKVEIDFIHFIAKYWWAIFVFGVAAGTAGYQIKP